MKRGAFAMLDALGYKGIWNRPEVKDTPGRVVERMVRLRDDATAQVARMLGRPLSELRADPQNAYDDFKISFLSDTVAIGVWVKPTLHADDERMRDRFAVMYGAAFASAVMRCALAEPPRLAFRGALSVGDFEMSNDCTFIAGPAVDDAAALHEQAQGAFVWIAPSAMPGAGYAVPTVEFSGHRLIRYRVPLKGGDTYDTFAVSPFDAESPESERRFQAALLLGSFVTEGKPTPLDVAIKLQNTSAFIEVALNTP
jgi:hypothetical protein